MQNENGYGEVEIQRYKDGAASGGHDFVGAEVPVALVFNGISHVVMLATPLDLADFALGFSFSEGIIDQRSEVYDIEEIAHPELGIEVHLTISNACFMRLKERRRNLVGRTGCGICGLESLAAFEAGLSSMINVENNPFVISRNALFDAFHQLSQKQTINKITGSIHAAAWVNAEGQVLIVREDLGRHNALDKLIGALLTQSASFDQGCVIMTSRASYELAQKTAKAGIPLLATISAPTSLAINLAKKSGLSLVGFVRNRSFVAYSHPQRIQPDGADLEDNIGND